MTFWDHLEELRKVILRIVIMVITVAIIAFFFKEELFAVVLAPGKSDFITYRFFVWLSQVLSMPSISPGDFHIDLINTQLTSQFMTHLSVALYSSAILALPYILYQLFRFVSPALYAYERRYATRVISWSYLLFMMGVLLNYFIIFPLTFRFLGTYQVSTEVINHIVLSSYVDTLMMLSLLLGILFEIPILSWLFAKLGFLTADFMKRYRRHALIIILIVAAIITPTADIFTLIIVSTPIYLLYEISILIVKRVNKQS